MLLISKVHKSRFRHAHIVHLHPVFFSNCLDLRKIIRILSDNESSDHKSLVSSEDYLESVSEVPGVIIGQKPGDVTSGEVQKQPAVVDSIQKLDNVTKTLDAHGSPDKSTSDVELKETGTSEESFDDDISDVLDLLSDKGN